MKKIGDHDNIIKVHEYLLNAKIVSASNTSQAKYRSAIVMELGLIDLFQIIKKTKSFSEQTARYFFKELLNALNHCHQNQVAHSDLKPENIILDQYGQMKVIDFGLGQ